MHHRVILTHIVCYNWERAVSSTVLFAGVDLPCFVNLNHYGFTHVKYKNIYNIVHCYIHLYIYTHTCIQPLSSINVHLKWKAFTERLMCFIGSFGMWCDVYHGWWCLLVWHVHDRGVTSSQKLVCEEKIIKLWAYASSALMHRVCETSWTRKKKCQMFLKGQFTQKLKLTNFTPIFKVILQCHQEDTYSF